MEGQGIQIYRIFSKASENFWCNQAYDRMSLVNLWVLVETMQTVAVVSAEFHSTVWVLFKA